MNYIDLNESFVNGAASVERIGGGLRPWRLPHHRKHLFPSPEEGLLGRAKQASGIRLRFETDASSVTLKFKPLEPPSDCTDGHWFDLVKDNRIIQSVRCGGGATSVDFGELGKGRKISSIWLPAGCSVTLTGLDLHDGHFARPRPDRRPLFVCWGSSLTHCVRAASAARTWPATVARQNALNLMNLGFGGQCCLDPLVAMYIRDLPADYILLKLGINTIGKGMHPRLYPALVTGIVEIIREKHAHTPIALISPIAYPQHETAPNEVGYTIEGMRCDMQEVHKRLVQAGDNNLYYVDGLKIFSVADIEKHSNDGCHPGADGIDLMAEKINEHVMPLLLGREGGGEL